ncbi:hypothetical protein CEXT_412711 [Caerostris extrusa]|uniref:Uncharacterized protein n=1 Tax=Caerostris extrusa TaxID=172846 RepID=A0AAV4XUB1_CAEEX|nr:hypothetical protein CEXT_412711 [Caerostris extrusa]
MVPQSSHMFFKVVFQGTLSKDFSDKMKEKSISLEFSMEEGFQKIGQDSTHPMNYAIQKRKKMVLYDLVCTFVLQSRWQKHRVPIILSLYESFETAIAPYTCQILFQGTTEFFSIHF